MMVIIYENINEKMAKEIMANGELIGGRYGPTYTKNYFKYINISNFVLIEI